jgi:intermediate peptidase
VRVADLAEFRSFFPQSGLSVGGVFALLLFLLSPFPTKTTFLFYNIYNNMSAGLGRILQGRAAYRTATALRSSKRTSTGRAPPTTATTTTTTTARVSITQRAPQTQVRYISGTTTDAKSAAVAASSAVLNSTSTPSLRELFDSPPVSSSRSRLASSASPEGLFLYPNLKTPETFLDSVNAAIARGHLLVERIAHAPEQQDGGLEMRKVIKLFDRLSDVLCKVIDAAEVVRCLHPDPAWRQAAETVYEELFSWMNTLNTDPRLYEVTIDLLPKRIFVNWFRGRFS